MRYAKTLLPILLLSSSVGAHAREEAPGTLIQCLFQDQSQGGAEGKTLVLLYRLFREDDGSFSFDVQTHDPMNLLGGAQLVDFRPGPNPDEGLRFNFFYSLGEQAESMVMVRSRMPRSYEGPNNAIEMVDGAAGSMSASVPQFGGPCAVSRSRDAVDVFATIRNGGGAAQ